MNTRLMVSLTVYLLAASTLFAQEERGPGPKISEELRQVIDDCHTSLNIARPERGERKERGRGEPSAEEIAKMKEMDANRQKIRACVESKGYSLPDHPRGDHHPLPFQDDSSESNASVGANTAQ